MLAVLRAAPAEAGKIYIETGLGAGKITNGGLIFSNGNTSSPGLGFSWNLAFAYNLFHSMSPIQIHLGAKYRAATSVDDSSNYFGVQTIAPMIRFETPRLYVGGSITPFVMYGEEAGTPPDLLGYTRGTSHLAYQAEGGLLWRVVPYFHFAIEASMTMIDGPGGWSPKPIMEGTAQLRFFLDDVVGIDRGETKDASKYDGWRYPFGLPVGD